MFPNVNIAGFSLEVCRTLAQAARAAYQSPEWMEAFVRSAGGETFQFISNPETGTQCFVARRGDDIVISFCGTKDLQGWRSDAKCKRTNWCGEKVHRGFATGFDSVSQEIFLAVFKMAKGRHEPRIWIVGHSLGGALAILCAMEFWECSRSVAGVYTFGQPRVGDRKFCRTYDSRLKEVTFRIVNENDLVPRTPFLHWGYRHCGQEIFINSFGGVDLNPTFFQKLISDLWGLARELNISAPPLTVTKLGTDHFMNGYTELFK